VSKSKSGGVKVTERTVFHEERAPYSFAIEAFISLVILFLFLLTLRVLMYSSEHRGFFLVLLILYLFIIIGFLWSFLNMRYRLTTEGVEATMPPFTYRVKYSEIDEVNLEKVPFWMGWGLRLWWRRIGFISIHKMSVVIRKKEGVFRSFWLSTMDAEKFADMLKEKMKSS